MKSSLKENIIFGYLILLIINVVEVRSGTALALIQLVLGLLVFLPKVVKLTSWRKIDLDNPIFKWLFLLSLLWGIYNKWYNVPNHLFIFFFLSLLLFYNEGERHYKENLRWIVVIVMAFATAHKLVNDNFLEGDFVAYRIASGDFFRPILLSGAIPEIKNTLMENALKIYEYSLTDPLKGGSITLDAGNLPISSLTKPFTYSIIGMEFLLGVLFAFFSGTRFAFVFLLMFVASIGLI
ncbi:MAG: hypothetical protein HKN31_06345, partial [Pricia sp.]|nr:hypothetical protein [Pricia sp.]